MIDDLPVAVALPAPLGAAVAAWVERDLGWQVVEPTGPLPPRLVLSDRAPETGLPWIAVTDGPPDDDAVTVLLADGAEDVVGWPDDRGRIPLVATRVDAHRPVPRTGAAVTVAGVAGGVGTSTVALALGGLLAWAGASVLVVGGGGLLELAGITPGVATGTHVAVTGVDGLAVARRHGDAAVAWTGDVAVVDDGVRLSPAVDVVVTRPDGGVRHAARSHRPVVVNGHGPLAAAGVARALAGAPIAVLPWSQRVARAGLGGRVPTALPGRWLRTLGDGIRRLEGISA